jgi:hypothetical protein
MVLGVSTAKCAFQALEGLDVDIETRSFFAIREYIFKRHSNRIAARESLGFEESRLSVQMYSILLLRILIRAPTEQPPLPPNGYGFSKAKSARCLHCFSPGPGHHHEMAFGSTGDQVGPVRGYQRVDCSHSCQGRPELFDSASVAISECD